MGPRRSGAWRRRLVVALQFLGLCRARVCGLQVLAGWGCTGSAAERARSRRAPMQAQARRLATPLPSKPSPPTSRSPRRARAAATGPWTACTCCSSSTWSAARPCSAFFSISRKWRTSSGRSSVNTCPGAPVHKTGVVSQAVGVDGDQGVLRRGTRGVQRARRWPGRRLLEVPPPLSQSICRHAQPREHAGSITGPHPPARFGRRDARRS